MAKTCVQCGAKIGFFQKAVDGVYCSADCSATAQQEMADNQRKADELRAEAEREAANQAAEEQAERERYQACPKCGKPWQLERAAAAGGAHAGQCASCGFSAELVGVEPCPSCRSLSFVIGADGSARCPRCKHRRG